MEALKKQYPDDYAPLGPEDARRLPNEDIYVFRDICRSALDWTSFRSLPSAQFLNIRDALLRTPALFAEYLEDNIKLSKEEKMHISRWARYFVQGQFIVWAWHTDGAELILTSTMDKYLVKGLTKPIESFVQGCKLPIGGEFVLLPWKDMIVSDGLMRIGAQTLEADLVAQLRSILRHPRELFRKIDYARPPRPSQPMPSAKELPDPNKNLIVMFSVWKPTDTKQWQDVDAGEKQLVIESFPTKGTDACFCGERPGALFQDCCQAKSSFCMMLQNPALGGAVTLSYGPLEIQSMQYEVRNVEQVLLRLHERSEFHCTVVEPDLVQWIFFGHPRMVKYVAGSEGLVCFGDLALKKNKRTIKLRTMNSARMHMITEFLGTHLKGIICHPRKKCHPCERIDKKTREKFKVSPSPQAQELDLCENCSSRPKKLSRCGRCRSVRYCSKECQMADWPEHKTWCGVRPVTIVRVLGGADTMVAPEVD